MAKKAAATPLKRALKALETRESIARLEAVRHRRGLAEKEANLSGELQRLHGQAGALPGLQAHVAQRRAALRAVKKKLAQIKEAR